MAAYSNGLQVFPNGQEGLRHGFGGCGLIQQEIHQHPLQEDYYF